MNDNEFSKIVDEYLKCITIKRGNHQSDFQNSEKDSRKINKKYLNKLLD